MRNALIAALLAAAALAPAAPELAAHSTSAQELRLGRPSAPALDESSFAKELADRLDEEISLLASAASGEPADVLRNLLVARANVRVLAQRLLMLAHQAGPEGSIAFVFGATLYNGRTAIDRSLAIEPWPVDFDAEAESAAEGVRDRFSDAFWSLVRFNESAGAWPDELRDPSVESLDVEVARLLEPLREALEAIEQRHATSHWVEGSDIVAAQAEESELHADEPVPSLAERLAAAPLPDETRAATLEISAILDAADEFAEFQVQADAYREHIEGAVAYAETLARAEWAPDTVRDRGLARLHAAVLLFKDKATREEAVLQLARLTDSRRTLERLTHLTTLTRHRVRPTALEAAFFNAEDQLDDPARAAAAREHLARLHAVLERMIAWRELREPQIRRELKVVCANLDRRYEQVEADLLAALQAMPPEAPFGADPNVLALLANHAQILRDLDHVQSIPAWAAAVQSVHPQAAERFELEARRTAQWLIDPARRAEAVRTMDHLAARMAMILPFPFEEPLRAGTADAVAMTSGQHEALLATLSAQRAAWIDLWLEREQAEVDPPIELLYRLMRAMADTVELARLGGDAAWLNRWAAWEIEAAAMAPAVSEAPNRLRLATQAAVTGNMDDLRQQLERIDAELPLAELIGRVAAAIGPALLALRDDGLSVVEQVTRPPDLSAWMSPRRIEFARICRYAAEEAHARSLGRAELADVCAAYVNSLAQDVLQELRDQVE